MIFYFLRQFTELSLAEIGKYFCYDHATVISACNTVDGLIRFNGYSNKTCVMAGRIDFEIKSFDIKKQDKFMEQWVLSMGTL